MPVKILQGCACYFPTPTPSPHLQDSLGEVVYRTPEDQISLCHQKTLWPWTSPFSSSSVKKITSQWLYGHQITTACGITCLLPLYKQMWSLIHALRSIPFSTFADREFFQLYKNGYINMWNLKEYLRTEGKNFTMWKIFQIWLKYMVCCWFFF